MTGWFSWGVDCCLCFVYIAASRPGSIACGWIDVYISVDKLSLLSRYMGYVYVFKSVCLTVVICFGLPWVLTAPLDPYALDGCRGCVMFVIIAGRPWLVYTCVSVTRPKITVCIRGKSYGFTQFYSPNFINCYLYQLEKILVELYSWIYCYLFILLTFFFSFVSLSTVDS